MRTTSLVVALIVGTLSLALCLGMTARAETWSGSGPGTVTVNDGASANSQLDFDLVGTACWSRQTWYLHTVAPAGGDVDLYYLYEGYYGWFQVRVFADAYVTHGGVTTYTSLVDLGPVNCCDYPSGWFDERGSVRLHVQAGDTYGFRFGGSNYSSGPEMLASFIVLPAALSPTEGTIGTALRIAGSGFGTTKGKVFVGDCSTTVAKGGWTDTLITCTLKTVPPPGETDVTVLLKPYGAVPPLAIPRFAIRAPAVISVSPSHARPGTSVTMNGTFFGCSRGKVCIESPDGSTKRNCKVTAWSMDPRNGQSTLTFVVPSLSAGLAPGTAYPLKVVNKVGTGQATFTVDP